ncbi:hypothetical protein OAI07_00080 [Akkermansiaceae bacterium]|nr:hypothetical protein [Akkermansiaceae bacterium]
MLFNKAWRASILSVLIIGSIGSVSVYAEDESEFSLDQVIHSRVSEMKAPKIRAGIVSDKTVLSSPSEKARTHVKQGFALIYAQWDFEAYRHFSEALEEDPDFLMAYAGIAFSLAKPHGEYAAYRVAAVNRILDLVEADDEAVKKGQAGRFPLIEKQFAIATANLVSAEPTVASNLFAQIGEEFPNHTMAVLTRIFLSSGGYDINGFETPSQKEGLEKATELLKANPKSPTMHSFLMSLMASAPAQQESVKKQALPSAHFLTRRFSDIPAWHHSLGHFSYLIGDYRSAKKAFRMSAKLYLSWMEENAVDHNDCEGYIKAMCYLADTLYRSGDFDEAMKVAKELRTLKVDSERVSSAGSQMLLWRGYTLSAHLYIARGNAGDMELAHQSLPDKNELKPYLENQELPTFVGLYIEALSTYIGVRKAIDVDSLEAAKVLHRDILTKNMNSMASVLEVVKNTDEYSAYYEASLSMTIYGIELAGLIAQNGSEDDQVLASSWFRSAIDRQGFSPLMLPASVIEPMENRLGEYHLEKQEYERAYESYSEALRKQHNNMPSLLGAKKALDNMDKKKLSAAIEKKIKRAQR